MTDTHDARVEAAARVMYDEFSGLVADAWEREDLHERSYWLAQADAVLQAADAVVTVEQIRDEIAGHPIGSGYYRTAVAVDEAREIAESVHALLTGEEA